jgi:hypothetical protein
VVTETDLKLRDGRTVHVYDSAGEHKGQDRLAVFWQHGTPNLGAPPEPLLPRRRPARHPLGVARPARLRRVDPPSRAET